jgi:raffinose/stachyose/melibiose transport system substrate-binding protein
MKRRFLPVKKTLALILTLMTLPALLTASRAEGITLRTTSNFFEVESVAQAYADALTDFEQTTGCTIEDNYTGLPDDIWKKMVSEDLAAGNLDVLFYYTADENSAAILPHVVPLEEVLAVHPAARLLVSPLLAEADGKIYAVPLNGFFIGLFINRDQFESIGIKPPADWGELEAAVAKFREAGVTPIAASLSDYPNCLAEVTILASGSVADYCARPASAADIPSSWVDGMGLLRRLYDMVAFQANVNQITDMDAMRMFLEKEAAMRVDGTWFAGAVPQEGWDSTMVVPFPACSPAAEPTAVVGEMQMGFYISRSAWEDPQRREAAVKLLEALTTEKMRSKLSYAYGDALRQSVDAMLHDMRTLCAPLGDAMIPEARNAWFQSISSIAEGTRDPGAVMDELLGGR